MHRARNSHFFENLNRTQGIFLKKKAVHNPCSHQGISIACTLVQAYH